MEEILKSQFAIAILGALGIAGGSLWVIVPKLIRHFAAAELEKLIDFLYEHGDDEADKILTLVLKKIDKEIPDGITAADPKVVAAARGSKKRADLYAALLNALNDKAKELAVDDNQET